MCGWGLGAEGAVFFIVGSRVDCVGLRFLWNQGLSFSLHYVELGRERVPALNYVI